MSTSFTGRINTVVYENEDFRILKVYIDKSKKKFPVTVKGNFYGKIAVGDWVSFEADWVQDKKYGKQLSVTKYPVNVDKWTEETILSALSAQGVSMFYREVFKMHCVEHGVKLFDLLNSGDLSNVTRFNDTQREFVLSRWNFLRTHLETSSYLYDLGLSSKVIGNIWQKLGTDIENVINQDPWLLVRVAGISFADADRIAERLGLSLENDNRLKGALLSLITKETTQGDLYIPMAKLIALAQSLLRTTLDPHKVSVAIKELVKQKAIIAHKSSTGAVCIYLKHNFDMETYCVGELIKRHNKDLDLDWFTKQLRDVGATVDDTICNGGSIGEIGEQCVRNWSEGHHITLTETQRLASIEMLINRVSVLTGLPGTGKTTTLQCLVSILKDASIPFLLCAPTGIAAKRLASVTGCEAMTVHRAFGAKGRVEEGDEDLASYTGVIKSAKKNSTDDRLRQEWEFDESKPHPAKFIVVDESSMLDLHMLYRLLLGTTDDCCVVFVGDPYQLPSVGSGDILRDLVSTKVFNHHHLDEIFRQKNTSGIVLAAHESHQGRMPNLNDDFVLFTSHNQTDAQKKVVQVSKRLYDKRYNFQVLSPRHGGDSGVTALNTVLRQALNPSSYMVQEVKLGNAIVREGDRVMSIRNDYNKGVYNGDVGKVSYIDKKAKEIEVKVHEGTNVPPSIVRYSFQEAALVLRLAYAQTVHKSQGQEYDIIVLPLLNSFTIQLQRNLFYTAITRAKKKVFIVGEDSAILRAVSNDKANKRFTLLDERIINLYNDTNT